MQLVIGKDENIKMSCEDSIYESLSIDGFIINYKNVGNTHIQDFFLNRGVYVKTNSDNNIQINGFLSLKGSDLHNFLLLSRKIDIKNNPTILDAVEEPKNSSKFRMS